MQCTVVGAGSWGTALAIQLCSAGHQVSLWDRNQERAQQMQASRQTQRYLPGTRLPKSLTVGSDLPSMLSNSGLVVSVIPSQATRQVWAEHADALPEGVRICCASKGIETGSLETMDRVLKESTPERVHNRLTFLCGPSFAKEVAAGMPTAVVVAAHDEDHGKAVADAFHNDTFRVYTTEDVTGAELGAALKNVIAIACGVADGLGLGLNARAALITRGLAEITRLAVARGGNPLTLSGLAGMGDLVLTCTGDLSRNRRVGLGLGQGKSLEQILEELGEVAEGVITAKSAHNLALKTGVEMPITDQIYLMLYEDKPVAEALRDLLSRQRKAERH